MASQSVTLIVAPSTQGGWGRRVLRGGAAWLRWRGAAAPPLQWRFGSGLLRPISLASQREMGGALRRGAAGLDDCALGRRHRKQVRRLWTLAQLLVHLLELELCAAHASSPHASSQRCVREMQMMDGDAARLE